MFKEDRYVNEIVTVVNKTSMLMFFYLAYQCHVYMSEDIKLL